MPRLYTDEIWGNVRDTANIPAEVKSRIVENVEMGLDGYPVNPGLVDNMIEACYLAYSMGWKDGFLPIDQGRPGPLETWVSPARPEDDERGSA